MNMINGRLTAALNPIERVEVNLFFIYRDEMKLNDINIRFHLLEP